VQFCSLCKYIAVAKDEGLRERKQRETREAIHRAAVRHALATSPDAVTVADISAEADVSTRTFFNYFPTKEDAMLGFHEQLPTEDELEEFANSDSPDLLRDTVQLMLEVFSASPTDREIMRQRRELIHRHPQLLQKQMTRVLSVETRVASVVAKRMRNLDAYRNLDDIEAAARILVILAISTVRNAIRTVANSPTLTSTAADDDRAIEQSLTTLREVVDRLI